jgi:hypothetical protein
MHMDLGFHPDERTLLNANPDDDDRNEDREAFAEDASDDEDYRLNWTEGHSILAWLMEDGWALLPSVAQRPRN